MRVYVGRGRGSQIVFREIAGGCGEAMRGTVYPEELRWKRGIEVVAEGGCVVRELICDYEK